MADSVADGWPLASSVQGLSDPISPEGRPVCQRNYCSAGFCSLIAHCIPVFGSRQSVIGEPNSTDARDLLALITFSKHRRVKP